MLVFWMFNENDESFINLVRLVVILIFICIYEAKDT
jgi:hypothetical protein